MAAMARPGTIRVRISVAFSALLAATLLSLLLLPAHGYAAEPHLVFFPGSGSFASTAVGQRSSTQYFELRNEGPGVAEIFHVSIVGSDYRDFAVEGDGCEGAILGAGDSCGVNVAFTPTTTGNRVAGLEPLLLGGNPAEATLEGTGLPPELTVSPSPLAFPTTTRYMTSEEPLTIENQSESAVNISGTNFEGLDAGAFGINGSNCAGKLEVGSNCTIEVHFNPQSEGEQHARLHIDTEGPDGGATVELEGLGAAPELSFEPGSFDFGLTQTNEGGERTHMLLRNVGLAPTQVGIETSGGAAPSRSAKATAGGRRCRRAAPARCRSTSARTKPAPTRGWCAPTRRARASPPN